MEDNNIHVENTWVQGKVVPNLNVQILYMDEPYLPSGADEIKINNNEPEPPEPEKLTHTPKPYVVSTSDLIILGCLDPRATIYCYFDYSTRPVKYTESLIFTDMWRRSSRVLSYAYGPLGVSDTVRLKNSGPEPIYSGSFNLDFNLDFDA